MSITELDEGSHCSSSHALWRESFYLNFHDAGGWVGGTTTIGVFPNQGRVQGLAIIFLSASRRVLFYHVESTLTEGAGLCSVPGIRYRMLSPLQKWRFEASADFMRLDPFDVVQGIPHAKGTVPVELELIFDALSPVYEFPVHSMEAFGVANRHYEQNGRVVGAVSLGKQKHIIQGFGFRDHSWGVRDLSLAGGLITCFCQFGPHLTVNASWGQHQGQDVIMGYISRDGVNTPLEDFRVTMELNPLALPKAIQAEIVAQDGQPFSLRGEVLALMPMILNQGEDRLHWHECLARFSNGQEDGYGVTEVTRLVRGGATTESHPGTIAHSRPNRTL
jgi:hypothetical protein